MDNMLVIQSGGSSAVRNTSLAGLWLRVQGDGRAGTSCGAHFSREYLVRGTR